MYIRSKEEEIFRASLWQIWANLESLELRERRRRKVKTNSSKLRLKKQMINRGDRHTPHREAEKHSYPQNTRKTDINILVAKLENLRIHITPNFAIFILNRFGGENETVRAK